MNILIVQIKSFPQRTNSFSWFYTQLTEWLTSRGIPSELYYCYLKIADSGFENGLLLPDNVKGFYSPDNIRAISSFIEAKKIKVVLDYSNIITGNTRKFYQYLKRKYPDLKLLTMIHSCPDHTMQLKRYEMAEMPLQKTGRIKDRLINTFPAIYLFLLKQVVWYHNYSAYKTMHGVVVLAPAYIREFANLIRKKDTARIHAIPNAMRPVESRIPVTQKNKEIIFVGRMAKEKAIPRLLTIWKMIQDRVPEWHFTIVGDGPERERCERIIREEKLQRIRLLEYQMALPLIDRSSILCLSSVIEGFPTVFTEAMDLGVVPIGFNTFAAIYDMIEDEKTGFIIPDHDYEAYAEKLVELCKNEKLRIRIATAAQNRSMRYDIEHIGPLWLQLFKQHHLLEEQ